MPVHVEVVSQEEKLFEEKAADIVLVPGSEGMLGILPNHTPLITTMAYGELVIRKGAAEERFAIYGGVLEVRPDKVMVLADAADFADRINLQEAEEARARIQKLLAEGVPPDEEAFIAAELKRAELAINISRRTQSRAGSMGIRVVREPANEQD
ncbi:MAG: ATP synthase F1 subunit epsilon [Anaerolineae bacterium]|nr:ATP synthase F1 subunit epsilon [Anaerolineae bacterium]